VSLDAIVPRLQAALDRPVGGTSDFDLNPKDSRPEGADLRPAAVLIALAEGADGPELVLTKRSSRLKHHPGQIAFPGGKVDEGDSGVVAAALREAEEEIGLPTQNVEVMGTFSAHVTVTNYRVTPVIGLIRGPFTPVPEAGEVEEVFNVPFAHVIDPARFSVQSRRWRGMPRYYYTVPYGPYYIWGATARILRALAERMQT